LEKSDKLSVTGRRIYEPESLPNFTSRISWLLEAVETTNHSDFKVWIKPNSRKQSICKNLPVCTSREHL